MVLLEKGIPFEGGVRRTGSKDEEASCRSCFAAGQGAVHPHRAGFAVREPGHRRLPRGACSPSRPAADRPFAAKVRELTTFVDLHLRAGGASELYGKAFFGGDISEANAERVRKAADRRTSPPSKRLGEISPYVAATASFAGRLRRLRSSCRWWPWLRRIVLGEDLLAAAGCRLEGLREGGRRAPERAAHQCRPRAGCCLSPPSSGPVSGGRSPAARPARRAISFAEAVELLHAGEAALHQQAHVVQDALDDLALPGGVELDLLVQPLLQPPRVGRRLCTASRGNSLTLTCRLVGCSACACGARWPSARRPWRRRHAPRRRRSASARFM